MHTFPVHTLESAPDRSKPALQTLQKSFGMIPNLLGAMATSPVLIDSLVGLFGKVHGSSFTEAQVQTLLLTDAVTNRAAWAVAFHTALALKEGLEPADVNAIREGREPKDPKLAPLSILARTLIEKRGHLDEADIGRFLAAGYSKERLLEAIAAVAASTITNYTASVAQPPLDEAFRPYAWSPADEGTATRRERTARTS
jgi:alkylhydroperoxidase family enzyme